MATKICIVFSALLCIASCGPLGEVLLNPLGSTVCETSPNLFGLGLSLPSIGMAPSTTVCESSPNIGHGLPYPFSLGGLYPGFVPGLGLGAPSNMGSTTVCESLPSVPSLALPAQYPYPYSYPYPLTGLGMGMGTATVCESSPNVVGLGGYGYGLNPYLPGVMGGLGSTTLCESSPNGLGYPFARSPFSYYPFL